MNILFIIPKMIGGGAERVTATLAGALVENHHVFIMTCYESECYYVSPEVKRIPMALKERSGFLTKIKNGVLILFRLRRIKKKLNIGCAISMSPSADFYNVLSRRKEKVIISVRCKMSVSQIRKTLFQNKFSTKHADYVVTLSKGVEKDQITKFQTPPEKLVTIYNPCDYERISLLADEPTNDPLFDQVRESSNFLVITAGRCVFQKGQWHLIRAFSKVVEQNPAAYLVILGTGELDNELQQLINDLHLENNIKKLGFKNNIYAYLSKADLFAFTSLYEGFGNILLEAMACSLPILACDCDAGPRELLAPDSDLESGATDIEKAEYGILTPVMDWKLYGANESLAKEEVIYTKALKLLMSDRDLLQAYKVKSEIRIRDFSLNRIVSQWEMLL